MNADGSGGDVMWRREWDSFGVASFEQLAISSSVAVRHFAGAATGGRDVGEGRRCAWPTRPDARAVFLQVTDGCHLQEPEELRR